MPKETVTPNQRKILRDMQEGWEFQDDYSLSGPERAMLYRLIERGLVEFGKSPKRRWSTDTVFLLTEAGQRALDRTA